MTTEIIKLVTAIIVLVTVLMKIYDRRRSGKPTISKPPPVTYSAGVTPRWAIWYTRCVYVTCLAFIIFTLTSRSPVPATKQDVMEILAVLWVYLAADRKLDAIKSEMESATETH
jgi:hypothetical protein